MNREKNNTGRIGWTGRMDWVTEYQIKWELEALRSICIDYFFFSYAFLLLANRQCARI